jgi:hypothetical protein
LAHHSPLFEEHEMKSILLLIVGIGTGFVIAHQVNKTPAGKQFFEDVDAKARDFSAALIDGYKTREAELRAVIADTHDALDDVS